MVQWYKTNGFNPVALAADDIPAQLKLSTGMIDAAPSPPYRALVLQIFRDAKYMLDVRVAPLVGALVHHQRRLERRSSAADRPVVIAAAKAFETAHARRRAEAGRRLGRHDEDARADRDDRSTPRPLAAFRAEAEKLVATMRGNIVPADVYDMARAGARRVPEDQGK